MVRIREAADLLLDRKDGASVHSLGDLRRRVALGLPKKSLREVAKHIMQVGSSMKLVHQIVPKSTYQRQEKLSPHASNVTARLALTFATATYVLGSEESARHFFHQPHPMLDGATPLEASLTDLGAREVESLLWRIFYGTTN